MCLASEICGTTRSLVTVQRLGCADLLSLYHRCLPTTRRPLTGATTIHQGAARASSTPSTLVTAVRCTRVQTIGQIRSFFRGKHSTKLEQTGAQRERPGVPHFWKKTRCTVYALWMVWSHLSRLCVKTRKRSTILDFWGILRPSSVPCGQATGWNGDSNTHLWVQPHFGIRTPIVSRTTTVCIIIPQEIQVFSQADPKMH